MKPRLLAIFCVLVIALALLMLGGIKPAHQGAAAAGTFPHGLVSVTFDDNYSSQTAALPALADAHIKATFYTVTYDIDNNGYMTLDEMLSIKNSPVGHEIASHSINHLALTGLNDTALADELAGSKAALEADGLGPIYDFAYPNGDYDERVEAETAKYYISGREGFAKHGFDTNNASNFDPYQLRVKRVLPTTTADEITDWVNSAKDHNEWLILMYHRIEALPPAPPEDENNDYWYSIAPDVFAAHMNAISVLCAANPATLSEVTVKEGMDIVDPPAVAVSTPDGNGTAGVSPTSLKYGDTASINITPNAGYRIASITDNGVNQTVSNPYVIAGIRGNHDVVVTFAPVSSTFTVTSIDPNSANQFGLYVFATISGTGFQAGSTVRFEKGAAVIDPMGYNVDSDTQISCSLLLFGPEAGSYDVVVTAPDNQEARLAGGFTVESACGQGSATGVMMLGVSLGLLSLAGSSRLRKRRRGRR